MCGLVTGVGLEPGRIRDETIDEQVFEAEDDGD